MDHNGRYYRDVEQQTQDYSENHEQQYPVNTFVDSEFQNQDQILNQDVAGCSTLMDGITYDIQQNCSVYNNAQTSQGHPQNRQVPVQIQDVAGCSTLMDGITYDIQQNCSVYNNAQTYQGHPQNRQVPVQIQDVAGCSTLMDGITYDIQQNCSVYNNAQTYQGHPQNRQVPVQIQDVAGCSTLMDGITYDIQQNCSVYNNAQTYQGHPQNRQVPVQIQDVAGCSKLIDEITYDIQQNCSVYNNAQTSQGHPQNRQVPVQSQDVAGCSTLIDGITYDIQQNCSVYNNAQTSQGHPQNRQVPVQIQDEYKLWYCSELTYMKDDGKEISDYYKPIAEIIFRKKNQALAPEVLQEEQILEAAGETISTPDAGTNSAYPDYHNPISEIIVEENSQAPAPEVVQEEQILDETAEEETVTNPDAGNNSNYSENLWELICKYCPAESSVSSLLACHLCDMSLVESENNENITCNTCFSRLPSGMTLKSHKKTRRHFLLLLNYKGDKKKKELFYCSTCKVQSKNYVAYAKHLLSQKHIEFEECLSYDLYFCNSCKLTMDATAHEIHLSSKTHLINCMISNIKSFCLISKLDVPNPKCNTCKENFLNEKSYKAHLYSLKHCSNLLELKLKDDFSHSNQYVYFNNNKYVCVLCKINIGDKPSLIYHFLTDEHMNHEISFQKFQYTKFVSSDFHFTSHFKEQYLKCCECKTLKRDCEHMFKNANEYQAWKAKIEKGKYCMYCNCFSEWSHESTELHKKMKEAVNYCEACDKILTIDIVKHEQGSRHRRTMEEFGTGGVHHKRGPSKLFCGICDINTDTEENHLQHLAGVPHRTKYNSKCIENRFHCKLCNFTVTELYQYEEHETSSGHFGNLKKIEREFDILKFCFICIQPITNGTLSEHTETVQHLDAIKMI